MKYAIVGGHFDPARVIAVCVCSWRDGDCGREFCHMAWQALGDQAEMGD